MGGLGEQDGYPVGVSNADFAGGVIIDCPHCHARIEIAPECPECGAEIANDDLEDSRA